MVGSPSPLLFASSGTAIRLAKELIWRAQSFQASGMGTIIVRRKATAPESRRVANDLVIIRPRIQVLALEWELAWTAVDR